MPATASIEIIVTDSQATAALNRLNAETGRIGPSMQNVAHVSEQTFNNIEHGALKARESAALLGEEFGVKIPRALRGTIAEAAGIGKIFTAAFSGLAIIGFIQIAVEAGKRIAEFADRLGGWSEQAKKTKEAQEELNKIVVEGEQKVEKLREAYALIGLSGLPRLSKEQEIAMVKFDEMAIVVTNLNEKFEKLQQLSKETHERIQVTGTSAVTVVEPTAAAQKAQGQIADVRKELVQATTDMDELKQAAKNTGKEFDTTFAKDRAEEIKKIAKATEEASAKLEAMASAARRGGLTGEQQITADALAQIVAVEQIYSREPMLAAQAAAAVAAISDEASRKRIALLTGEADKRFKIEDEEQAREEADAHAHAEKLRRFEDETLGMERAAAIAMAPPWERANARIVADYEERIAKIRELIKAGDLDAERDAKLIARMQAAAFEERFSQMRDKLAGDLENLFDNITSGNIGKFFLQQFKHLVFQMVASWILGMQQMKGASQQTMSGGGGILGAIFGSLGLGGIFGGGASGGGSQGGISNIPGVITNFGGGNGDFGGEVSGGGSSGGLLSSLGLSAGGGAGAGVTLPSGAGPGGGLLGRPLGGLLSKVFSHGLGPISGGGLAALGIGLLATNFRGGGILHGLGGALGGAALGFSIGGPIGALIGAIGGFLVGIFGHSTKKARLAIEADIKRKAATIEDSYNLFQSDWTTSRDALEQLRQQGVDALKQAGVKDINRSRVGHVDQWIDKAEKEIDLTQAERNRRAALTFGPAQFRVGGFVGAAAGGAVPSWFAGTAMHFAGGGAVPAILHEGEYVMRPEAVSRLGRGNLDSMNSGGSGTVEVHMHFPSVYDPRGFEETLLKNTSGLLRTIRRMKNEGMM